MIKRVPVTAMVLTAALMAQACGVAVAPSSALPRTTDRGVAIDVTEATETVPIPGCHSYWQSRNEDPPPGACEETVLVRRFVADGNGDLVETVVHGSPAPDPSYGMQLVSRSFGESLVIVVVVPPEEATLLRLIDDGGSVVDEVVPTDPLVVLAAVAERVTVEALSADGSVVAQCPADGVVIDGVTYVCSPAPGHSPPVTTTTIAGGDA